MLGFVIEVCATFLLSWLKNEGWKHCVSSAGVLSIRAINAQTAICALWSRRKMRGMTERCRMSKRKMRREKWVWWVCLVCCFPPQPYTTFPPAYFYTDRRNKGQEVEVLVIGWSWVWIWKQHLCIEFEREKKKKKDGRYYYWFRMKRLVTNWFCFSIYRKNKYDYT